MDDKQITQATYEDLRNKLKIMEQDNQRINEQLFSLQNKFYVQTKILNDKNAELSKEVSMSQKIKSENSKYLKESSEYQNKIDSLSKENNTLKSENEKIKKELVDLTKKFNESNLKSNYLIGQLEEQNSLLSSENQSLKDSTNKLKSKIDFITNEMKAKESKLVFTLKNESKENEQNLRSQILSLQKENESLAQESMILKKEKQSLFNELSTAIETTKKNNTDSSIIMQNNTIMNLENRVKELVKENEQFREQIKSMESSALMTDKKIKALKLDLQQSEKDTQNYYAQVKEKENIIIEIEKENNELKCELEKNRGLENVMIELQEKNQQISFLFNQIDDLKRKNTTDKEESDIKINSLKQDNISMIDKLECAQNEIKATCENYQKKIQEIQKENDILINDLNEKEKEYAELLNEKAGIEAKYDQQFHQAEMNCENIQTNIEKVNQENEDLKHQISDCVKISTEKYDTLNKKLQKSKTKIESLMSVYDNHITYLKERFDHILSDVLILVNLKTNPKDLNDKFNSLIKNIKNSLDDINKLSEREALIENFKIELKNLKNAVSNKDKTIKQLQSENFDLNQALDVKRLQMKIQEPNEFENSNEKIYYNLVQLMKEYDNVTQLNVKISNLQSSNNNKEAEINLLNDKVTTLQEKTDAQESKLKELTSQLSNKTKEVNELTKSHKNEIKTLMDEVKRIRETWTPNEKKMEYVNTIAELEKTNKSLKDDVNRKRDIIATLKNQLDKNDSYISNQEKDTSNQNLIEKIKHLSKEITRKEVMIKELKSNCENYKTTQKKIFDENENLVEKNKVQKIDIQRKDLIIKDLKEKVNSLNANIEKTSKIQQDSFTSSQSNTRYQKLKSENERKDNIIKTLKAKNEALSIELNQIQSINLKMSKNNSSELEREQKFHSLTKDKLDYTMLTVEKMSSCIRRILKDLLNTYESEKRKANILNITNTMKEGMNILGVTENDVDDFLNPNNENYKVEITERVNELLESEGKNFDCENIMNIYNLLKDKINQLQNNNNDNNTSFVKGTPIINNVNTSSNNQNAQQDLNTYLESVDYQYTNSNSNNSMLFSRKKNNSSSLDGYTRIKTSTKPTQTSFNKN